MMLSGIERVVYVHGFLGLPEDWREFARPQKDVCVDLWPLARQTGEPFELSSRKIVAAAGDRTNLLIGYSMGARLAMQALLEAPKRFHAAIFVSGHPGLARGDERAARCEADRVWARRFREQPWAELLRDWNHQNVMVGTTELPREEKSFERESLAWALENWSLGKQSDLKADLAALEIPILYLTGAEDKKFSALAREIPKGRRHQTIAIAGAGHRLPWQKPAEFIESVRRFAQTTWTLG